MKIGIDLGGTNIAAGIVDGDKKMIAKSACKTKPERGAEAVIADMAELTRVLCQTNEIPYSDITEIGVGCPGTVDHTHKNVVFASNIGWKDVQVAGALENSTGKRVLCHNDATCAAIGELTSSPGYSSLFFITIGTGVGGGYIKDGRVFSGARSSALEIGHLLRRADGGPCGCGRRGCLETYASFTGLIRRAAAYVLDNPGSPLSRIRLKGKEIFELAKTGDPAALSLVGDLIENISHTVIDIANLFDPEIIVIGGGISKEGDYVLKPVIGNLHQFAYSRNGVLPEVRMAVLGNDAGIIGAAELGEYI